MGNATRSILWGPLLVTALATPVTAQQEAGTGLTIAKLYVKSKELPEGCRFAPGMPCATHHMEALYSARSMKALAKGVELPPEVEALFPVPKTKEWQSFEAEGGVAGSVFLFEYTEENLEKARALFPGILYGQDEAASNEHPEEIIFHGSVAIVLSFPRGDPAAEWYKQRLRKKFKVPALREHLELRELGIRILEALQEKDVEGGLALFDENADRVESWAFGQYLLGVFCTAAGDPKRAEKSYRRALELHDTLEDPLRPGMVWATLDAMGLALLQLGKPEAALPVLVRAELLGLEQRIEGVSRSSYNLACASARLKRWAQSWEALERAIEGDPECKEMARTDKDLAEARERKEFKELLK